MVNCQIWLAAPQPETAAEKPALRRARIEGEAAIDQSHHGCDVFAESRERERGSDENARIFSYNLQCPASEIEPFSPDRYLVLARAEIDNIYAGHRAECERGPEIWVAGDRLLQEGERVRKFNEGTQIKIIGGELARGPLSGPPNFGSQQRRLYDASNAEHHLVLKLEDVIEGAIKAISPEMRPI